MGARNTLSAPPPLQPFLILNGPGHYSPFWFRTCPTQKKKMVHIVAQCEIQNGSLDPGMVTQTFSYGR